MTEAHKKQLAKIGLLVAAGVPIVLGAWIAASHLLGLDVVLTCRLAGVSSMLLLAGSIVLPLLLDHPREARLRGFVIFWFVISVAFNLVWELPLVCFKSALHAIEVSRANLPLGITWWSYTLSDADYRNVTPFVVTIELWWLLANSLAVVGLVLIRRGSAIKGHIWLGVAGALQAYNASLYIVGNAVMDGFANVPKGSVLAQLLYWGFNFLWTGAAIAGSIGAFRIAVAEKATSYESVSSSPSNVLKVNSVRSS
jgi:hypothetical protein